MVYLVHHHDLLALLLLRLDTAPLVDADSMDPDPSVSVPHAHLAECRDEVRIPRENGDGLSLTSRICVCDLATLGSCLSRRRPRKGLSLICGRTVARGPDSPVLVLYLCCHGTCLVVRI